MARKPKKSRRFDYNLESVLNYRNIREKQEQEQFAKAKKKYEDELEREETLKTQQQQEYQELRGKMAAGQELDFQQLSMRRTHLDTLKEKVVEQVKVREEAESQKEEKRKDLTKAVKDRKILDKDKEKKKDAWKKLMSKEEDKFLDDIASVRHDKKRREA